MKRSIFSILLTFFLLTAYCAVFPPSTNNKCPVTKDESSDARNRTALAISIGSAKRFKGIYAADSAIAVPLSAGGVDSVSAQRLQFLE